MNLLSGYGSDDEAPKAPAAATSGDKTSDSDSSKKRKEKVPLEDERKKKKVKLPSAASLLSNIPVRSPAPLLIHALARCQDALLHGEPEQQNEIDPMFTKYNNVRPPTTLLKEAEDLSTDWKIKPTGAIDKKKAKR